MVDPPLVLRARALFLAHVAEPFGFGLIAPADRAGDHQRDIDRRQHVGVEQPLHIFFRFEGAVEQQVIPRRQPERAAQLLGDDIVGALDEFAWKFDRFIGVGHPLLVDPEHLDDIALRLLRDGDDMIRLGADLAQQPIGLPLIVERRERQPQRHQIVDRVDVARAFRPDRQLIGAVQDVRARVEFEIGEPPAPREVEARIGKQVARDKDLIAQRQARLELIGDDGAAEVDRHGLYAANMAQLIDSPIVGPAVPRHRRRIVGIKKRNLTEHRIFCRAMRRAVDDPDIIAELTHEAGEQPRIGRDAGAAFEREVETVEIDAPAHRQALAPVHCLQMRSARRGDSIMPPPLSRAKPIQGSLCGGVCCHERCAVRANATPRIPREAARRRSR